MYKNEPKLTLDNKKPMPVLSRIHIEEIESNGWESFWNFLSYFTDNENPQEKHYNWLKK